MTTTPRRKLTEPLESVTAFFGLMLLIAVLASVVATAAGSGSIFGLGDASVCATQGGQGSDSSWTTSMVKAKPGASVQISGQIEACADHPSVGERLLYTLVYLPGELVWGCVLLLLWRLIVVARRTGPFTMSVALTMRRLGWVIIAGSVVAAALQGLARDQLLSELITPHSHYVDALIDPVRALLPVPLLAGAALLTFARIIRLGADMDDEIKGTV
jgi:hypothetical protein